MTQDDDLDAVGNGRTGPRGGPTKRGTGTRCDPHTTESVDICPGQRHVRVSGTHTRAFLSSRPCGASPGRKRPDRMCRPARLTQWKSTRDMRALQRHMGDGPREEVAGRRAGPRALVDQPRRIGRAEARGRARARSRANTARPAPAMRAIPTHTTGPGTSPNTTQPQKMASGNATYS